MAQQVIGFLTGVATTPIEKGRAMGFTGARAGAGESIYGVVDATVVAGEQARVIPAGNTADAEAGAAINGTERRLATDAQGRFVPWTAGVVAARLVPKPGNVAAAAGDLIEVYVICS